MRKLGFLIPVALLAAFALAACGGGDNNSEDEDQITEAIEQSATSGDPSACTEFQTQKFVEQTNSENGTGEAAVKACEKNAKETPADSVDVSNIEVDGDSATAEAAFTGKFLDGQALDLGLVKEADTWKLDSINDFAEFDREKLIAQLSQPEEGEQASPQQQACVKENLNKASDEELQSFLLDPASGTPEKIFGPCFGGGGGGGAQSGTDTTGGAAPPTDTTGGGTSGGAGGSSGSSGGSGGGSSGGSGGGY